MRFGEFVFRRGVEDEKYESQEACFFFGGSVLVSFETKRRLHNTSPHNGLRYNPIFLKIALPPTLLGGGNSNIFYVHPDPWGFMIQFDEHSFQGGWFNHQLDLRMASLFNFLPFESSTSFLLNKWRCFLPSAPRTFIPTSSSVWSYSRPIRGC